MKWSDIFYYKSGKLYWKVKTSNRVNVGEEAGSKQTRGYIAVCFNGKKYRRSRVIYEMFNGTIPSGMEIDHINHVHDDDRIENLRITTRKENMRNQPKKKNNKTGTNGVYFSKAHNLYVSAVELYGKKICKYSRTLTEANIKIGEIRSELGIHHENHGK